MIKDGKWSGEKGGEKGIVRGKQNERQEIIK